MKPLAVLRHKQLLPLTRLTPFGSDDGGSENDEFDQGDRSRSGKRRCGSTKKKVVCYFGEEKGGLVLLTKKKKKKKREGGCVCDKELEEDRRFPFLWNMILHPVSKRELALFFLLASVFPMRFSLL